MNAAVLVLPRELTIYSVGELRPQWLDWLHQSAADPANDSVDASAVDEVDAAGVQLLLSLQHALNNAQRTLQLLQPSPALVAACTALGLASLTGATP